MASMAGDHAGKRHRVPASSAAVVNRALIAACVLGFVLQLPPERFAFVPAYFFGTVELAGPLPTWAVWRGLLGHVFVHGDWLHLTTNMALLWLLGDAVEAGLGHARYLLLFSIGTVAGALLEGRLTADPMAPLIGASGAICAVMGAWLVLRPRARIWVFPFLRLPVLWVFGAFALLNLYFTLVPPTATSPLAEVGWAAHLGGFAAGLALAPLLRRKR